MHDRAVHYPQVCSFQATSKLSPTPILPNTRPYISPAPMTRPPLPTIPAQSPGRESLARLAELGVLSAASAAMVALHISWNGSPGNEITHLAEEATDDARDDTVDGAAEVGEPEGIVVEAIEIAGPSQW
jgi:hypothetical protein